MMGRTRGLVVGLTALIVFPTAATAVAAPPAEVLRPPGAPRDVDLRSLASSSARDVWAVGTTTPAGAGGEHSHPITRHWDGTRWQTVPSFGGYGSLYEAAEVAPDDVWAVGDYETAGDNGTQVLMLHWDGTAWTSVQVPTGSGQYNVFASVSVISADNVLAQGFSCESGEGPCSSLAIRWNGTSWQNASGIYRQIGAVDVLTPHDAWGVGESSDRTTLAAHWDGHTWHRVATPDLGPDHPLTAVSAIAKDDVWAVGQVTGQLQSFTEHWDGVKWTVVPDAMGPGHLEQLTAISGTSADDVWLTGMNLDTATGILEHWDGTSWHNVSNPGTPRIRAVLYDVEAFSGKDAWTVGRYDGAGGFIRRLLMHWDGKAWTQYTRP